MINGQSFDSGKDQTKAFHEISHPVLLCELFLFFVIIRCCSYFVVGGGGGGGGGGSGCVVWCW